jgi:hypothetical protein
MDALDEAGLDLELREFGKRLDSLLISRGWPRRLRSAARTDFELSAKHCGPDRVRLTLDVMLPESVARQIMALVVRHGLTESAARRNETPQG